jgi:hypothetical protein
MTLRTFLELCTDPNNIEEIVALNIDGEPVKMFGYWDEKTVAEFDNTMSCWGVPKGNEWDAYFKEWSDFQMHLKCDVIEYDVLNRSVKIESTIAYAIEGKGKW